MNRFKITPPRGLAALYLTVACLMGVCLTTLVCPTAVVGQAAEPAAAGRGQMEFYVIPYDTNRTEGQDGTTWTTAFNGLSAALEHVNDKLKDRGEQMVTLRLAVGEYINPDTKRPGASSGNAAFSLPGNLRISGSFIPDDKSGLTKSKTDRTILSGRHSTSVPNGQAPAWEELLNWSNVVRMSKGVYFLEDVVVTKGWAAFTTNVPEFDSANSGGGVYIESGTQVTLQRVVITNNLAYRYGGGILNRGHLLLRNCTVAGNACAYPLSTEIAKGAGGGIYTEDVPTATTTYVNTIVAMNRCYATPVAGQVTGVDDINKAPLLDAGDQTTNSLFGTLPQGIAEKWKYDKSKIARDLLFPLGDQPVNPGFLGYRYNENSAETPFESPSIKQGLAIDHWGLRPVRSSLAVGRGKSVKRMATRQFKLRFVMFDGTAAASPPPTYLWPKNGKLPVAMSGIHNPSENSPAWIYCKSGLRFPVDAYEEVSADVPVPADAFQRLCTFGADGKTIARVDNNVDDLTQLDWPADYYDSFAEWGPDFFWSDVGAFVYPLQDEQNKLFISTNGEGCTATILGATNGSEEQLGMRDLSDWFAHVRKVNSDDNDQNDIDAIWMQTTPDAQPFRVENTLVIAPQVQVVGGFADKEAATTCLSPKSDERTAKVRSRKGGSSGAESTILVGSEKVTVFYCENALGVILDRLLVRGGRATLETGLSLGQQDGVFAAHRKEYEDARKLADEREKAKKAGDAESIKAAENAQMEFTRLTDRWIGGGGIRVFQHGYGYTSSVNLLQVAFIRNRSERLGGAIWTNAPMTIKHSTIVGNWASGDGAGLAVQADIAGSVPLVESQYSVFAMNERSINSPTSSNVAGPLSGHWNFVDDKPIVGRTKEQGAADNEPGIQHAVLNNRVELPADWKSSAEAMGVMSPELKYFRDIPDHEHVLSVELTRGSPLVDAGPVLNDDVSDMPQFDLAGRRRIQGHRLDLGAYEYPFEGVAKNGGQIALPSPVEAFFGQGKAVEPISTLRVDLRKQEGTFEQIRKAVEEAWRRNLDSDFSNDVVQIVLEPDDGTGVYEIDTDQTIEQTTAERPLFLPAFVAIRSVMPPPTKKDLPRIVPSTVKGDRGPEMPLSLWTAANVQGVVLQNLRLSNPAVDGNVAITPPSQPGLNHGTALWVKSERGWGCNLVVLNCQLDGWTRHAVRLNDVENEDVSTRTSVTLLDTWLNENTFNAIKTRSKSSSSTAADHSIPGGGALQSSQSDLLLARCHLVGNSFVQNQKPHVTPAGGAIFVSGGQIMVIESVFLENSVKFTTDGTYGTGSDGWKADVAGKVSVPAKGGAIHVNPGTTLNLVRSTLVYNSVACPEGVAGKGAAISIDGDSVSKVRMPRNLIVRNQSGPPQGDTEVHLDVPMPSADPTMAYGTSLFGSLIDSISFSNEMTWKKADGIVSSGETGFVSAPTSPYPPTLLGLLGRPLWHVYPGSPFQVENQLPGENQQVEDVLRSWKLPSTVAEQSLPKVFPAEIDSSVPGAVTRKKVIPYLVIQGGAAGQEVELRRRQGTTGDQSPMVLRRTHFDSDGVAIFRQVLVQEGLMIWVGMQSIPIEYSLGEKAIFKYHPNNGFSVVPAAGVQ